MFIDNATTDRHDTQHTGTTREFMVFCASERERRSQVEEHFDPVLFDAAVAYIVRQLTTSAQETGT
jgi:hypothetical protein